MKCEIIQDLLPLYIDGLTSEESNDKIEEHLQECKECPKIYGEMSGKIGKELEKSILPEEKKKINYLRKIKRKTMLHILAVWMIVVAFTGIFFLVFEFGMHVKQSEVEITLKNIGIDNWELILELKDGKNYDLHVVGNPKDVRMIEEDGEISWEYVHEVKKVLHNPLLDDRGDTMSIGGRLGDGSKHIFQFDDGTVVYEDGKVIKE